MRQIDWNVTARTGTPHVRIHLAERALVTWLVLDTSPSMTFGTAERRKADVAEGAALAIGYAATRRGNRLGLVTFGDEHPRTLPARQGRAGLLGLLLALRKEEAARDRAARGRRDLGRRGAACASATSPGSASYVVVVSDFRGPRDWRRPLLDARRPPPRRGGRDPRRARAGAAEVRASCASSIPRPAGTSRSTPRASALRTQFAAAAAAGAPRGRGRDRLDRRAARRAADARRLAARPDRLPAPRGRAMSFSSPIALLALILVPIAAVGYVLFERRRVREAAALRPARAAAERRRPRAGLAQAPAGRAPAARGRGVPDRLRAAARDDLRRAPRRRRRSSRSTPRARWARGTSRRRGSPPRRPRRAAFLADLPEKYRVSVVAFSTLRAGRGGADDRPRVRRRRRSPRCASARRPRSATRLATSVDVARGTPEGVKPPAGREAARPRSSSCSPTARSRRRARRAPRGHPPRARGEDPRLHGRCSGPRPASSTVPHVGGYVERIQVPPESRRRCARVAPADGRQLLRGADREATSTPSTPTSSRASAPRDKDEEITFAFAVGGRAAAARRLRALGALVQAGAVIRAAARRDRAGRRARRRRARRPGRRRVQGPHGLHPGRRARGSRSRRPPRAPPRPRPGGSCAREGVVGGVDARASEVAVAVEFPGRIGSPVNPGITTTRSLVFKGTYAGRVSRTTSYRPFIGCIPGGGGGPRTPTASRA